MKTNGWSGKFVLTREENRQIIMLLKIYIVFSSKIHYTRHLYILTLYSLLSLRERPTRSPKNIRKALKIPKIRVSHVCLLKHFNWALVLTCHTIACMLNHSQLVGQSTKLPSGSPRICLRRPTCVVGNPLHVVGRERLGTGTGTGTSTSPGPRHFWS